MKNIEDILTAVGGTLAVAQKLKLREQSVQKWITRGIPQKHWAQLIKLSKGTITASQIFALNQKITN